MTGITNPLATQYVQQFVGQRSGYDQEVCDGIFCTAQGRQAIFRPRYIRTGQRGSKPHSSFVLSFYSSFVLARLPYSFVRLYQINLYFRPSLS